MEEPGGPLIRLHLPCRHLPTISSCIASPFALRIALCAAPHTPCPPHTPPHHTRAHAPPPRTRRYPHAPHALQLSLSCFFHAHKRTHTAHCTAAHTTCTHTLHTTLHAPAHTAQPVCRRGESCPPAWRRKLRSYLEEFRRMVEDMEGASYGQFTHDSRNSRQRPQQKRVNITIAWQAMYI